MTTEREKIIAKAEVIKRSNDMFGDFSVALYHAAQEDERAKRNSADAIMQSKGGKAMSAAIITIDGDTYEGTIELVSEVEPGQCVGCIFDTFNMTPLPCPKDKNKKLRCSAYSAGRTGIYVFVPQGKEIPR